MINKWLHLDELGGDPWVLPIWAAIHEAIEAGKIKKPADEVYDYGVYISIRLNILPRIVKRLNKNAALLYEEIKMHGEEHIFIEGLEGCAYPVENDLKYELLADIDALIFEINATWELIKKLFSSLYGHIGIPIEPKKFGSTVADVLNQNDWFKSLDAHRNFFMHEGAPYLAVDLSVEPDHFDLLILKKNIISFSNPDDFVALSDVNAIVHGFVVSKLQLQTHLITLFRG